MTIDTVIARSDKHLITETLRFVAKSKEWRDEILLYDDNHITPWSLYKEAEEGITKTGQKLVLEIVNELTTPYVIDYNPQIGLRRQLGEILEIPVEQNQVADRTNPRDPVIRLISDTVDNIYRQYQVKTTSRLKHLL
jgi:hypothetical protein